MSTNVAKTETAKICLLNPGPVTLTEGVRQALLGPDLCHREPAFTSLMTEVRQDLLQVYEETGDQFGSTLLTGSGTCAVEAMVDSLVPRDRPALVCANGVYGERIGRMLEMHGKQSILLKGDWAQAIDLGAVEAKLREHPNISYVVAVHHETTTGRLNDLAALGDLAERFGVPMLVDAVSSFGAAELPMLSWNITACAATANKCLHGVPGIAFVIARKDVLQQSKSNASSLYLDLWTNYSSQEKGYPAFTPAIQTLYALKQALAEFAADGGWQARRSQYAALTEQLIHQTTALGYELLLREGRSEILTAFQLPSHLSFDRLYEQLRDENFVIYAGQQHLLDKIFRISVMGDLTAEDIDRLHQCLSAITH